MRRVRIGDRLVGDGQPVFVIAEAGVNHNGDIDLAKKLVDAAKAAGADAVKFQAFNAENVATKNAKKARYQVKNSNENNSQLAMLKQLELDNNKFRELFIYAKKRNIAFLASAFDKCSVDLLDNLKVPAFKIASGEITNFPLLKYIAEKKKPIILSTGMSTMNEITDALRIIQENGATDIILLHCVTSYPAKKEETNLRVIETLRERFKLPVGFSDHTTGIATAIAATALGAVMIEKHFTLDKNLKGPDHKASLEPDELKEMIQAVRDVEKALGNGVKKPTKNEEEIKIAVRRSIVAKTTILKGTVITEDLLDFKRPGDGLGPKDLTRIIGMKAKNNISPDELITFDKLV